MPVIAPANAFVLFLQNEAASIGAPMSARRRLNMNCGSSYNNGSGDEFNAVSAGGQNNVSALQKPVRPITLPLSVAHMRFFYGHAHRPRHTQAE